MSSASGQQQQQQQQHTQFLDLTNGEGGDLRVSSSSQHPSQYHPSHSLPPPPSSSSSSLWHHPTTTTTTTTTHPQTVMDHHHPASFLYGRSSQRLRHSEDVEEEEEEEEEEEPSRTILDPSHITQSQGRSSVASSTTSRSPPHSPFSTSHPHHHHHSTARTTDDDHHHHEPGSPGRVVDTGREHTGRWTRQEHEAFLQALRLYGKEWKKVAAKVKTRTVVQTRTHAQKYFQKLQKTMEQTGMEDITHVEMGTSSQTTTTTTTTAAGTPSVAMKPKKSERKKARTNTVGASGGGLAKQNRRSSNTTISAAHVISNLSNPVPSAYIATASSATLPPGARHGFSTTTATATTTHPSQPPRDAVYSHYGTTSAGGGGGASWMSSTSGHAFSGPPSMKIVAPDPSASGFPEPSPAATGKRKLAEIAAARMLAGVAGGSMAPPAHAVMPPGSARMASSSSSYPNGGPPTPPTPPPPSEGSTTNRNLKDAPTLPPLGTTTTEPRKGLSLQIVNPESLGVIYDPARKSRGGGDSPVTPWDGQLEALVIERQTQDPSTTSSGGQGGVSSSFPSLPFGDANVEVHPVCGPGTSFRRTPLHKAVCDADVASAQQLLEDVANQSDGVLKRIDGAGYCPLHTACAIRLSNVPQQTERTSVEMVTLLLSAGADQSQVDHQGNTPLHWAARAGDKDVALKLLMRNCPFDAKNQRGETPLHWAMRSGRRGMEVTTVLLENGARPGILDENYRRPVDVAAEGFLDNPNSLASLKLRCGKGEKIKKELKKCLKDTLNDRRDCRENFLIHSAYSRTLVLHHPECLEHHPKSETDWEAPDRVKYIMNRVLPSSDSTGATETSGIFPHEVTVSKEFDRAKLDLLSRVHSTEYLSFVNELSKDLEKQLKDSSDKGDEDGGSHGSPPPVVPFTPQVQRSMIKIDDDKVKCGMTSDTSFSVGSLKAARRAAGAVQHAVDCVLVGRNRNAFCVVRPPGHHAGISGLLEGGESCGFCIFNNVAAGALYAISDDRLLCNRCAIVDIDVHHGNGTEEIVRKCHDPSKLFFFSIHLYDNDKKKRSGSQFQYKFYPGTGDEDDLALNIINVPIVPLWKEPGSAAPVSSRTHNTRQKTRSSHDSQDDSNSDTGTPLESSRASDVGSDIGSIAASSPRHASSSASSGRLAYRQAIQSRLLPALRAFNPDLIIVSAGFDAAKGDVGNARHERGRERMGLDLEPEDYAWTTRKILEIADICCQGRVVSVLEGGYGRTPATAANRATEAQGSSSSGLDRTLFAECAVRHLHAMIDPYDSENRFG